MHFVNSFSAEVIFCECLIPGLLSSLTVVSVKDFFSALGFNFYVNFPDLAFSYHILYSIYLCLRVSVFH